MQDLDSDQPKLQLPNGELLQGAFEEHLGTILLFAPQPQPSSAQDQDANEADAGAARGNDDVPDGGPGASPPPEQAAQKEQQRRRKQPIRLQYKCHTDKLLTFQ